MQGSASCGIILVSMYVSPFCVEFCDMALVPRLGPKSTTDSHVMTTAPQAGGINAIFACGDLLARFKSIRSPALFETAAHVGIQQDRENNQ